MSRAGASISLDGVYRYRLWRWLDPVRGDLDRRGLSDRRHVTFIMLNPSTANEIEDDPTIRRCIAFAKRARAYRMDVVNLYALRATYPKKLWEHSDPCGIENDRHILDACRESEFVIAAWGAHGARTGRGSRLTQLLREHDIELWCLGVTKAGEPKHPLYLRGDTAFMRFPEDAPATVKENSHD